MKNKSILVSLLFITIIIGSCKNSNLSPEQSVNFDYRLSAETNQSCVIDPNNNLWYTGMLNYVLDTIGSSSSFIQLMDSVLYVDGRSEHFMILKTDSTLWMCGKNVYGELGDGTNITRNRPVKIADHVIYMSSGINWSVFIKSDHTGWACGLNDNGQLGDGTRTNRNFPVKIIDGVKACKCATYFTFYLKDDNTLWSAGTDNRYYDMGIDFSPTTLKVVTDNVAEIENTNGITLILKKDHTMWGCGDALLNLFGISQYLHFTTSNPVKLMDGIKHIGVGYKACFMVKEDNSLWACGENLNGNVGVGTELPVPYPVYIMSDIKSISSCVSHTLCQKTDNTLWVFGSNFISLGTGNNNDSPLPQQIYLH